MILDRERTMRTTMAMGDIKLTLPELVDRLSAGDELILTRNQQVVAKLVSERPTPTEIARPGPGLCRGMITYMAPDFDAPLEDMKEYME
jgi:antitoxin (DNA-binding transcriptional repressor) of toxin-antitoxin stability system